MKKLFGNSGRIARKFLCLFLALVGLFGSVNISALAEDLSPKGSILTTFYTEPKNSADVVFVGSSSVYRFISTTQLYSKYKITSLNYGAISMHPRTISGAIQEITSRQRPKVIVIEMRRFIKLCNSSSNGKKLTKTQIADLEYKFKELIRDVPASENRSKIIKDTVKPWGYNAVKWEMRNFYSKYNLKKYTIEQMREILKKNYKSKNSKYTYKSNSSYVGGKYKGTIGMSRISSIKVNDYSNYNKTKEINGEMIDILNEIISAAKNCKAKVLFVSTPHSTSKTKIAYENALCKVLEENGFDYLNCNKLYGKIGLNFKRDYYDTNHTNVSGMVKVTNYIGKYLVKNYKLKETVLTKAQKKSWDKATDLWIKEVRTPMNKKIKAY